MKILKRLIPDSVFGQSTLKLVGGTSIAQVIAFAALPLLTRVYEPGAYGVFAALIGLASTLTVVSSLSYEVAIPVIRRHLVAVNTVFLCIVLLGVNVAFTAIVLVIFASPITEWLFGDTTSANWLHTVPLLVATLGINQVVGAAAVRVRTFNVISGVKILQAIITAACQIVLFSSGTLGLIAGVIAGQISGAKYLWNAVFPGNAMQCVSWRNIRRTMIRFRRFPIFEGPFSLINSAGNYLPPVLLIAFFNPTVGGIFALAQRVLSAPIGMLTSASGQVFFAFAAQANREGKLGALVTQVHINVSRIALPPLVLIALTGPYIFSFVFGDQWREAGLVATLLTPWLYTQALGSPVSTVWVVQSNLHHGTVIGCVGFILRSVALFSAIWVNDWVTVIAILSVVNTLYYLFVALYAVHFSGASISGFAGIQAKAMAAAIALALPAFAGLIKGSTIAVMGGLTVSGLFMLPYFYRAVKRL